MRIIDSNIIIYAAQTNFAYLLPILDDPNNCVSEISKLEVLGYHKIDASTKKTLTDLFDTLNIIPIDSNIINKAVEVGQTRKMSIGDAIIAATALLNNFEVITRNVSDFKSFKLSVMNPVV
jgi:toxin FitB